MNDSNGHEDGKDMEQLGRWWCLLHLLQALYPVKIKNGQLRLIINLSRLPISINTHLLNFWFTGSQQRSAREGKR